MVFYVVLAVLGPHVPDLGVSVGRSRDYEVDVFFICEEGADLYSVSFEGKIY